MARSITFFFVWFSFHSLTMSKNTEAKDEEHRKKLEDLVQGFDRFDSASLGYFVSLRCFCSKDFVASAANKDERCNIAMESMWCS